MNIINSIRSKLLLLGLAAGITATNASADTITWGNSAFDSLFYSNGSASDAQMNFEIGTFGSFVPTASNLEQWESNWRPFDRANSTNGDYNVSIGFFGSSADTLANGTSSESANLYPTAINPTPYVFPTGEQAYLWAYKTKTYEVGLEWALVTNNSADGNSADDWKIPPFSSEHAPGIEWRIGMTPSPGISLANNVVFGGMNNQRGPGEYTNGTPDGDPDTAGSQYTIQTGTLAAVPEPGSAMLIGSVGLMGLLRRRRRA
jgi:hypothetical protein